MSTGSFYHRCFFEGFCGLRLPGHAQGNFRYYSEEGALDVFWIFFAATVAYFVVDLLWLLLKPQSVKSPNFIMGHHVVTMTYLLLPYNHPQMAWCMGACKFESADASIV